MITKKEIKDKLDEYDQNRSCFKVGFFLYAIDYFHPDTKFYYDLRNFYNQDLSQLSSQSELSSKNIEMLAKLINSYQIGPLGCQANGASRYGNDYEGLWEMDS